MTTAVVQPAAASSCPLWEDYYAVVREERLLLETALLGASTSIASGVAEPSAQGNSVSSAFPLASLNDSASSSIAPPAGGLTPSAARVAEWAHQYRGAISTMPGAARPLQGFDALLDAVRDEMAATAGEHSTHHTGGILYPSIDQLLSMAASGGNTVAGYVTLSAAGTGGAARCPAGAAGGPSSPNSTRGVISTLLDGTGGDGGKGGAAGQVGRSRPGARVGAPQQPIVAGQRQTASRRSPEVTVRQTTPRKAPMGGKAFAPIATGPAPLGPLGGGVAGPASSKQQPSTAQASATTKPLSATMSAKGRSVGRATRRSASQRSETSGTDLCASFSQNPLSHNKGGTSNAGGSSRQGGGDTQSQRADPLAAIKATQRGSWLPATEEPGFVAVDSMGPLDGLDLLEEFMQYDNDVGAGGGGVDMDSCGEPLDAQQQQQDPVAAYLDEQAQHLDADVVAHHLALIAEEQERYNREHAFRREPAVYAFARDVVTPLGSAPVITVPTSRPAAKPCAKEGVHAGRGGGFGAAKVPTSRTRH